MPLSRGLYSWILLDMLKHAAFSPLLPSGCPLEGRRSGLDRTDFLMALARKGVDAFSVDFQDLERELGRG